MTLRSCQTGEMFEWTGSELKPRSGAMSNAFEFNGSDFREWGGGHGNSFTWDGSAMRHYGGDNHRSVEVRGSDIAPFSGDTGYWWEFTGGSTLRHRTQGKSWDILGDVPVPVLAGFVAAVLNPRLKDEDGGDDDSDNDSDKESSPNGKAWYEGGYIPTIPAGAFHAAPNPWNEARKDAKKVKLVIGCSRRYDCDWDEFPKAPEEEKCFLCKEHIAEGARVYYSGCSHNRNTAMCTTCGDGFRELVKINITSNKVIDFSRGGCDHFIRRQDMKCANCEVIQPAGYISVKSKRFYCVECAKLKKYSVPFFKKLLCG